MRIARVTDRRRARPRRQAVSVVLFGILPALVHCSSGNPSAQSTYDQFVSTYCQALMNCQLITDATQCEQQLKMTLNGTEACSQSQVDQCMADIKKESCSALLPTSVVLPTSCNGC
jgi:hypothetical protein